MSIHFVGLPSDTVAAIKTEGKDAYGLPPDRRVSEGAGFPCRHCLGETPRGADYLIVAHRPFEGVNAYTETGPIFLCADACLAWEPSADLPPMLRSPSYIVRGYTADERIRYGTGRVVETPRIAQTATQILEDPEIAFVDVRSASNNCFQCRVVRAPAG